MRLQIIKSKNAKNFYVVKSIYHNKKRTNIVVEKLGNIQQLKVKAENDDPYEWAKKYVEKLNAEEESSREVIIRYSPKIIISKGDKNIFNCGYLFLEKIYYELGINNICTAISKKYKFSFDLNSILSRLIYSRIIYPSSKLKTNEESEKFIEQPNFTLHQIYRALEIIAKENEFIQACVYKNSLKIASRNSGILYYDCTNFFFEIEEEENLKEYGESKENRPNPIVQMGLFMDGDGIPLTFNINPGSTNEQTTMTPTEEKIVTDFKLSKFVVCTDAGLSSTKNRIFNSSENRAFVTTQSIKKLKAYLIEWVLSDDGWKIVGDDNIYKISEIKGSEENYERYKETIFYKERYINENELEQRLIVTYSIKYGEYQKNIRNLQIERASKLISSKSTKLKKVNAHDCRRFIKKTSCTNDGEIAENETYSINQDIINKEAKFDGFYGVCTNLVDDVSEIIKINRRRWEIEESFRIMKSEFKARPVYLQRDDRIIAHFTTCFLSLVVYRYLEKKLNFEFTYSKIIDCLKDMNLILKVGEGYIPAYVRNDMTDCLHEEFGFRTDYEINTLKNMKKILSDIKK